MNVVALLRTKYKIVAVSLLGTLATIIFVWSLLPSQSKQSISLLQKGEKIAALGPVEDRFITDTHIGDRYVYRVNYVNTAVISTSDADLKDLSGDKRVTLQTSIREGNEIQISLHGLLEATVVDTSNQRILIRYRWQDEGSRYNLAGGNTTQQNTQKQNAYYHNYVEGIQNSEFYRELDEHGNTQKVFLSSDNDQETMKFWLSIAEIMQVVVPDSKQSNLQTSWTATEQDSMGTYKATYTIVGQTGNILHIDKEKKYETATPKQFTGTQTSQQSINDLAQNIKGVAKIQFDYAKRLPLVSQGRFIAEISAAFLKIQGSLQYDITLVPTSYFARIAPLPDQNQLREITHFGVRFNFRDNWSLSHVLDQSKKNTSPSAKTEQEITTLYRNIVGAQSKYSTIALSLQFKEIIQSNPQLAGELLYNSLRSKELNEDYRTSLVATMVSNGGKQGELFAVKIFETPDFTESIQLTALGNLIGRRIHSEECKNKISAILGNPNTPGKIGINAAFVVGDQIKLASSEPEVYKPWLSLIQAKLAETQDLTTVQYILFGLGNANVKEIIPIAEKYLKHDEEAIRTAAILSLRQVEDPRAIDVAITALQREKSASAKSIMIRNIAEYNHINSVISRIDNYLDKESDPSLINRALRLLSERTPNAIGLLVKYKDHPSDLVKETVREQLGNYKF